MWDIIQEDCVKAWRNITTLVLYIVIPAVIPICHPCELRLLKSGTYFEVLEFCVAVNLQKMSSCCKYIYLSMYLSIYIYISVHLTVCLSVYLSMYIYSMTRQQNGSSARTTSSDLVAVTNEQVACDIFVWSEIISQEFLNCALCKPRKIWYSGRQTEYCCYYS